MESVKEAKDAIDEIKEENNLAIDMLKELKKTVEWQRRAIKWILLIGAGLIAVVVGAFVWLWQQYDYVSEYSVEAAGIYTTVDNNGNVITSQDISEETWKLFIEWLDGRG